MKDVNKVILRDDSIFMSFYAHTEVSGFFYVQLSLKGARYATKS